MTIQKLIQLLKKYGVDALNLLKDELAATTGNSSVSYRFLLDDSRLHIYTLPLPYWVDNSGKNGYTNLVHIEWNGAEELVGVDILDTTILGKIVKNCLDLEKVEFSLSETNNKKLTDTIANF